MAQKHIELLEFSRCKGPPKNSHASPTVNWPVVDDRVCDAVTEMEDRLSLLRRRLSYTPGGPLHNS